MGNLSVFVGSSSEALPYAKAVRACLEDDGLASAPSGEPKIDVTLWSEDFFVPTSTFIESLANALPRFDFAVFVLTPDDLIGRRDLSSKGPRDNVVFELGLFMGHLGRARTFALVQEDTSAIPSDLAGVVTARYRLREGGSERAAVGAACDRILKVVRNVGISEEKTGRKLAAIADRQNEMESQVKILRLLAKGLITDPEKDHMRGLAGEGPFLVWFHNDMMAELKHLDARRYVLPHPGKGLNHIYERDGKAEKFDLKNYVHVTDMGREYLRLLDQLSG
jgi:hypothetical protein